MAYAAISSLNYTLYELLKPNQSLVCQCCTQQHIQSVYQTLSDLQDFLEDKTKEAKDIVTLKVIEKKITSVVYKAEDRVDTSLRRIILAIREDKREKACKSFYKELLKVEEQIYFLNKEVMLIEFNNHGNKSPELETTSFSAEKGRVEENTIIGMEDDFNTILDRLISQTDELTVIPIFGMGGIGKTTLARKVYDDSYIRSRFDKHAWVIVSNEYNKRQMLLELVYSITGSNQDMMSDDQLMVNVFRGLKGRRFLIVIDDIWSNEAWEQMKRIFPDDDNKSRILITTRLKYIADYVSCPDFPPHRKSFLSLEDSWNLFTEKLFKKDPCPPHLEEIGKHIVQQCRGLPLSVVVVAGLVGKMDPTHDNWNKVEENLNSFFGTVSERCQSILSLSYSYLPQHLRACFLYMGGFPQDREINVSKLIRLWIAEQFIKERINKRLEVVAEEYLEELIDRSLVLTGKQRANGRMRSCKIHDLLRQLCLSEAHTENVVHVMNGNVLMSMEGIDDPRRVIVLSKHEEKHVYRTRHSSGRTTMSMTRTFISMPSSGLYFPKGIYFCVSQLKLIKVLDVLLIDYDFSWVIPQLVHLTYVAARIKGAVSLDKLRNLRTIILMSLKEAELEHPLDIWRMSRLRHVDIGSPLYISNPQKQPLLLNHLRTLHLCDSPFVAEIIKKTPELKKLKISHFSDHLDWFSVLIFLKRLKKLETLIICAEANIDLMSFSMDIFPPNLKKLTLSFTCIPWEVMDLLADLPNLEVLKGYDAFKGTEWILNESVVFRKLKYLQIVDADLKRWEAHSDNFPMLEQLILNRFHVLQEIPDSIGEIMTLKFIKIKNCGPTVVTSANKIQQDQENWGNYDLQVQITPKLITISEISSKSTQCILKVRVVRMWIVSDIYKSGIPLSLELVLQDEKGDHICASIEKSTIKYFKDKIQELGLYEMNNFVVAANYITFTTSTHKHRLIFTLNTIVTEIPDSLFHMNIFNLRTFDQLTTQHNVDEAVLFDVIGQVVTYGPIQIDEKEEKTRCYMKIVLEDDKKNRLSTTLFDELTDQIQPHLCRSTNEPLIIVLQLVKAYKFRENYYVHSCRWQSKLWINPNLPQPTDFKNRLVASSGSKHERFFQTNSQHISDELSKGIVPFKFLSDLIECTKESAYWIAAKIVCLKLDRGWSHLICNICFALVNQEGNKYYCSECNKEVKYVIHRYNIQMYVTDGTAFISLLLLNREALQLVGKPAKELKEGLLEDVECSYPSELDDLIEKKLMFKVMIKESNIKRKDRFYEVVRLTDDETLLKTYCHPSIQDILNDSSFDYGQSSDRDKHFELITISEISSKSTQCILKVRVVRMWIESDKYKTGIPLSLELVLQDEKGDRIHASIGKSRIKYFKDKIQELDLYEMSHFVVAANYTNFITSTHKHRLIFTLNTIVTEIPDSLFHMNIFNLRTFDQLTIQQNVDEAVLFDVIGQVVTYGPIKIDEKEENTRCYMKVVLEDDKKNRLSTTLWDELTYQIQPHLCGSTNEPLIIVLQLVKAYKFRENYFVHSCWYETKLWINSNLPQPTDFKNRLVASCGSKFERIFQTNSQQYTIQDELSKGIVPFKFLSDLIQCTEESAYWIAAKVVYLKLDHGWSYLACNKCFTMMDQEGNKYYCSECNKEVKYVIHRYNLQMYVTDGTAFISLFLGNREALQLIGKPAKELNEGLLEDVECSYPSEFDDLIEKKLMFKVMIEESNISKNDDVYKVIEFTNDETLLKKYCQPSIQVTLNDSSFDYGQSYGGDKHFKFNTISEISSKSMQWILKVRVIRMWIVPDKYKPKLPLSLELILQDEKGDRIYASIGKYIIKYFKDKIQDLGLYQMEYFVVAANILGLKTSKHKHRLIFTKNTIVTELHDSLFHMNIFNLRTFDQLTNQENMDETELFDVVGQVVSYKPFKNNKEGDNDMWLFKVVLEDDKKNRLSTNLLGKHAYQIQPHLCESADEPLIVVLQLMKVHKLRENYFVHSCWYETKLWINSNLPQPTDFKNRLVASCGPKFERIFQTNSQQYTIQDELSKGIVPFKFLSDLIQCTEESAYWIAAKVVCLKIDHGWSHSACNKCFTVVDQVENIYYCSKCNEEVISIIHRYNLQMYVTDGTAFISLLLLNKEALQLIGKPAKELKEGLLENIECSYPSELNDLIEKKFMFKVMIKKSNINKKDDVYKVIEFTNDETLLKKYCQPSIQDTIKCKCLYLKKIYLQFSYNFLVMT